MKLPKRKYWYHATSIDNARSIVKDGMLKSAWDGIYFANTSGYAENFCLMRGMKEWAVIKVPTKLIANKLERSYDHAFQTPDDCHFAVYRGNQIPVNSDMIELYEAIN